MEAPVKERPILFSAPMVRAILYGRKTQTRRVMAQQPYTRQSEGFGFPTRQGGFVSERMIVAGCPYGIPGDRLWVKETWRPYGWRENKPVTVQFREGLATMEDKSSENPGGYEDWYEHVAIQATEECEIAGCEQDAGGNYFWSRPEDCPIKWRSPIFMPRWASRITLEITEVRVERVQEISVEDSLAEGIVHRTLNDPRVEFQWLWDSINEKRGYGWDKNPWVWDLTFRRID